MTASVLKYKIFAGYKCECKLILILSLASNDAILYILLDKVFIACPAFANDNIRVLLGIVNIWKLP